MPRHPSQLYEAACEGVLLFLLLLLRRTRGARRRPGVVTGLFLAGYAVARMSGELFREPDAQLGFLFFGTTMGQLLSIPLLARRARDHRLGAAGAGRLPGRDRGLAAKIARRIRAEGPLTVAAYMAMALHDPQDGYYATPRSDRRGTAISSPRPRSARFSAS